MTYWRYLQCKRKEGSEGGEKEGWKVGGKGQEQRRPGDTQNDARIRPQNQLEEPQLPLSQDVNHGPNTVATHFQNRVSVVPRPWIFVSPAPNPIQAHSRLHTSL